MPEKNTVITVGNDNNFPKDINYFRRRDKLMFSLEMTMIILFT